MDRDTYEGLIERLEAQSEHAPAAFRGKVLMISSAAYVALFGLLAALALAIYWGVALSYTRHNTWVLVRLLLFALVLVPVLLIVLRVFFMRLPPPGGRVLARSEAPRLFELLDKMRAKLKGPPIHEVQLDRDFNAAIVQHPRFGLFGGHRNYLILGLPYLIGLPPKEMLATVAHEYGHLCGNHGKVGAWVYRQRRTFRALHAQVMQGAQGNWLHAGIAHVLDRFMPVYNAYTFVLSRQDEYNANRTATEVMGADASASGLTRGALLGRWVHEEFWPHVWQQADTSPRPSFMPFAAMRTAFHASYEQWATSERLKAAWLEHPDTDDTHPSLRERVEATGQSQRLPARTGACAADALLGNAARSIIDEFDTAWWQDEQKGWTSRHQYAQRSKARLRELAAMAPDTMAAQDLQELALLKAEFESPKAAKPVLEFMMRKHGPFPKIEFLYGRILVGEGDERGLEYLVRAATRERSLADDAARIGYNYLYARRGEAAADAWLEKLPPSDDG